MLLLLLLPLIVVAQPARECRLEDNTGIPLPLSTYSEETLLGRGITYDSTIDIIRCVTAQACQNWTISGCTAVYCLGRQACQYATLRDNLGIACWAHEACHNATLLQVHDVSCGDGHSRACFNTDITTNQRVHCVGPGACGFHKTIRVGREGQVQCSSGQGQYACHDMVITISHGQRACYFSPPPPPPTPAPQQESWLDKVWKGSSDSDSSLRIQSRGDAPRTSSNCAVVCDVESDCDKDSIRFVVEQH